MGTISTWHWIIAGAVTLFLGIILFSLVRWIVRQFLPLPKVAATAGLDIQKIISEYGRVLGEGTTIERDIRELPYSKSDIKRAILTAITVTSDEAMINHLEGAFISLGDFQDAEECRRRVSVVI